MFRFKINEFHLSFQFAPWLKTIYFYYMLEGLALRGCRFEDSEFVACIFKTCRFMV